MSIRIHIFGASGSGTTTFGRALAKHCGIAHFDTDNFFWIPGDPPYGNQRPIEDRIDRLCQAINSVDEWILTGSLCGWGDFTIGHYTLAVFLFLAPEIRLKRLRDREAKLFGDRIKVGGALYEQNQGFMEWATQYDEGASEIRSKKLHEQWIKLLSCPLLRLDGKNSVAGNVQRVVNRIGDGIIK